MTTTTLPEFKGKLLIERPADIPQANFLDGDFGRSILADYNKRVKEDYADNKRLYVLFQVNADGTVLGSNPFAVVLVNQIIRGRGLRTATQADLEKILRVKRVNPDALDLRGTYEDSALVLRTEGHSFKPNDYLEKNLAGQLKARGKLELPAVIALKDLDLVKDEASHYGLAFKLRDDAEVIYAPILNKAGNFNSEDVDEKTGLPTKVGKGDRSLHVREAGLSRLVLVRDLGTDSYWGGLDYSVSDGRVVIVSGSAA